MFCSLPAMSNAATAEGDAEYVRKIDFNRSMHSLDPADELFC